MSQFHSISRFPPLAQPAFADVRLAPLREEMDRPNSFDPLFLKLLAPDLFRDNEAGAIVRAELGLPPGEIARLRVKIQPRFFAGHSRTTACAKVEASCGSEKRTAAFAIKLITGCEKKSDPVLAGAEVDISRAYRRDPLFKKHFAAALGLATLKVSDEIKEKMTIEYGLHPMAIPHRAVVQFNRWVRGVPLESAVIGYLNSRTEKEIRGSAAQDELVDFGSRVLDAVTLSWARMSNDTGGVLFDTGAGDIILSPPPGIGHMPRARLLRIGDPVFIDPDGGIRCGGAQPLESAKREFLSTMHFAILSPARATRDPAMFGELSERVQRALEQRHL